MCGRYTVTIDKSTIEKRFGGRFYIPANSLEAFSAELLDVHQGPVAGGRYAAPNLWRRQMDDAIGQKILSLLNEHRIMTLATLRPDGRPQATTVGYVNDGLTLYFLCGLRSQKAVNIAKDNHVSLTIDHDTDQIMEITGISMAARATAVTDRAEAQRVIDMMPLKYPAQRTALPGPMPKPEEVRIFRLTPVVISVLDYTKGFGHTDLITCS
jgi:nitroimidazol reductase NimA-like FMN-containing flavoprotein (pyridoxamine 5'-phosphate oxidase superfamily)